MLDIGKKYWFRIVGNKKEVNLKGEVLEENDFLVKIRRDDGVEEILTLKQILHVNEAREGVSWGVPNKKEEIEVKKISRTEDGDN